MAFFLKESAIAVGDGLPFEIKRYRRGILAFLLKESTIAVGDGLPFERKRYRRGILAFLLKESAMGIVVCTIKCRFVFIEFPLHFSSWALYVKKEGL